jgi:hypothetical protein
MHVRAAFAPHSRKRFAQNPHVRHGRHPRAGARRLDGFFALHAHRARETLGDSCSTSHPNGAQQRHCSTARNCTALASFEARCASTIAHSNEKVGGHVAILQVLAKASELLLKEMLARHTVLLF